MEAKTHTLIIVEKKIVTQYNPSMFYSLWIQ